MSNILQNIKMTWELMSESSVWTAFISSNSPAVALPLGQAVLTPTPFDVFVLFIIEQLHFLEATACTS